MIEKLVARKERINAGKNYAPPSNDSRMVPEEVLFRQSGGKIKVVKKET